MIIHQPEIIAREGHTLVFSRLTLGRTERDFPEYLWYRVPNHYGEFLTTQSDAFLVPGLLAGMYIEEDIEVRGTVSPRLAYHLDEYQHILNRRFPDHLHKIEVKYERLAPLAASPKGVGTTFTGGVDSLFTLWEHLPQNQPDPDFQVTHCLFIKGFDILHKEKAYYELLYEEFAKRLTRIGVELIPLETNIVSIIHMRMPLPFYYGPTILGAGISLAGLFQRFYIPSSWDYQKLKKGAFTSDPLVDSLLSTDALDIINHGTTHRRVDKVEIIADWELAQELLWVCTEAYFQNPHWNCSRCEKCVRTMIPLYALGTLGEFKTFARPLKTNKDGLWWARKFSLRQDFFGEIFPFVKKHKPDLLPWLRVAASIGYVRYWMVKNLPAFAKKWLRRYGYFVLRNESPNSYEMPEIVRLIRDEYDHTSA
jgi:hypothetical protein